MSSFPANSSTAFQGYNQTKFVSYNPSSTRSKPIITKQNARKKVSQHMSSDKKKNKNCAGIKDISILPGPTPKLPYISNVESPALLITVESGFLVNNEGTVG